jgi:hypothetical protein
VNDEPAKKPAPARWSPEEESRLAEAFKAGQGVAEIAEAHSRSRGAIEARLHLLDLVSYGPYTPLMNMPWDNDERPARAGEAWSEPELAELLVAHQTGAPLTELAQKLARTPRGLVLKLVNLGLVTPEINPTPNPLPRPEPKPRKLRPLKTVAEPTRTQKISVTGEFQAAAKAIERGEHTLILGSAGTGKSTFLRYLKKLVSGPNNNEKKRYVTLAPTGMAALNVGGQTIHSFFGFKPGILTVKNLPRPRQPKLYEKLDLLIIDEVSMVRADMFEAIDHFLRAHGPHPRQPFGGVQLCLIGDLFQLPPIVSRDEQAYFEMAYPSPHFFSSQSYREVPFTVIEFSHIFRQADVPFISLLSDIRHATHSGATLEALNRRLVNGAVPDVPTLTARVFAADAANRQALEALPGAPRTYGGRIAGTFEESALPAPLELTLKPGARIMFTKNDTEQRWVNGTLGTVLACGDETVTVKTGSGETFEVEPATWERTRYKYEAGADSFAAESAGSYTQLPLAPAWALTIHKAQGQTLPGAVVDLSGGGAFAEGQLYVALSRVRSLNELYLKHPISPRDVKTHPAVAEFYRRVTA